MDNVANCSGPSSGRARKTKARKTKTRARSIENNTPETSQVGDHAKPPKKRCLRDIVKQELINDGKLLGAKVRITSPSFTRDLQNRLEDIRADPVQAPLYEIAVERENTAQEIKSDAAYPKS